MYETEDTGFGVKVLHHAKQIAILGHFPSNPGDHAILATKLAAWANARSVAVETYSEPLQSYARNAVEYRSRRIYQQSLSALPHNVDAAVIFSSAIRVENISKSKKRHRAKELWRRLHFPFCIGRTADQVILVCDRSLFSWGGILSRLAGIGLAILRPGRVRLCSVNGFLRTFPEVGEIRTDTALEANFTLTYPNQTTSEERLNPVTFGRWLRSVGSDGHLDPTVQKNLQEVQELARHCWQTRSNFLRHTRGKVRKLTPVFAASDAEIDAFLIYFQSFTEALSLDQPNRGSGQVGFERWYATSDYCQRSQPPLPLPDIMLPTPHTRDDAAQHVLTLAPRVRGLDWMGEHLNWFTQPIIPGGISKGELFLALCANANIPVRDLHQSPWSSDFVRQLVRDQICAYAPSLRALVPPIPVMPTPPRVAIAGIVKGESGLARNAIMNARAFQHLGVPSELRDITSLHQITRTFATGSEAHLRRSVNLYNINADRIPRIAISAHLRQNPPPFRVGYCLWESDKFPDFHRFADEYLDEIWVPSEFVRDVFRSQFETPAINVGKALYLPPKPNVERTDLFMFMSIFDRQSGVERKNPLAVAKAFQRAFPDDPGVRLVIKGTPAGKAPWEDPNRQLDQIQKMTISDPRIALDLTLRPFPEFLRLLARADCIVSAHRAEGFGYIPAFALKYAIPVIATDYSGTKDFCTPSTSFPVAYQMTQIPDGHTIANIPNATWAEVDQDDLVHQMIVVRQTPDDAQARALAGQKLVGERYGEAAYAARIAARLRAQGVLD